MIDGQLLVAGEYSLFLELAEGYWTLIVSNHEAKQQSRSDEPGIWGAYGYSTEQDVLRASMQLSEMPVSFDQFTMAFVDVHEQGGKLAIMWENTLATIEFSLSD